MPDINWDKDFRLAVIQRIAGRLRGSLGGRDHTVKLGDYGMATGIHLLSFMPAESLGDNRATIESALGCTLEEVKEEMERDGKK